MRHKTFDLSIKGPDLRVIPRILGISSANILAAWSASHSDGGYLRDISGNGRHLAPTAGPTIVDSSLLGAGENRLQAFSYDGATQRHSLAHDGSWMNCYTSSFALSLLVKSPSAIPGSSIGIYSHGNYGNGGGANVIMNTSGYFRASLNKTGSASYVSYNTNLADGMIHFVNIVRSGATWVMFVDGNPTASASLAAGGFGADSSDTLYMGFSQNVGYWSSQILWGLLQNTALTLGQIRKALAYIQGVLIGKAAGQTIVPTFQRASSSLCERKTGKASLVQVPSNWPVKGPDGGILIEGAVTPLFKSTNDLSGAAWLFAEATYSATPVLLRDGTTGTKHTFKENDTNDTQHNVGQLFSVTTGTSYCQYWEFKYNGAAANPREWVVMMMTDGVGLYGTWINIRYGTLGTESAAGITGGRGVKYLGDGWYGAWIWVEAQQTLTDGGMAAVGPCDADNDDRILNETAGGQDSFFCANQQLQTGRFPTTHVPRPTAAATSRAADFFTVIPWRISKDLDRFISASPTMKFLCTENADGSTVTPTVGSFPFTKMGVVSNDNSYAEGDFFYFDGTSGTLRITNSAFVPTGDFGILCTYTPLKTTSQSIFSTWGTAQKGWVLAQSGSSISFKTTTDGVTERTATVSNCLEVGKPVLITVSYSVTTGATLRVDAFTPSTHGGTGTIHQSTSQTMIACDNAATQYLCGNIHRLNFYNGSGISTAEHNAAYAAFKLDGILPLVMSATTPKTKLVVEFEAKCQFTGPTDIGTYHWLIDIGAAYGTATATRNRVHCYANNTGAISVVLYDSTGGTVRNMYNGVSDTKWGQWNRFQFTIDLSELANSTLYINGINEKDGSGNMSGPQQVSFLDTIIRVGQSYANAYHANAEIRNPIILAE